LSFRVVQIKNVAFIQQFKILWTKNYYKIKMIIKKAIFAMLF
jgi:hypothetical protein